MFSSRDRSLVHESQIAEEAFPADRHGTDCDFDWCSSDPDRITELGRRLWKLVRSESMKLDVHG